MELTLRRATRALAPAVLILALQLVFFPMPTGAVLSGVVLGLLGALGAVGIALVWRANKVINFAQGDLGALPATLSVLLITLAGLPWLLGVTIGLAAAVVVGVLADVLVIRRFFRAPRLVMTVATIGLAQILGFCSLLLPELWDEGPAIRTLPPPFEFSASIGGVVFDANDLIAAVVSVVLLALVALLLRFTDTGVAVRAAADRSDRAAMLGIPVRRLEAQVWTLATVLSFCSVMLTAGVASLPFGIGLGLSVVLRALAALVIGRMTHLVSIATTAVAIGVLEAGIRWNTGEEYLIAPILAALIVVSLLLQRRGDTRADRDDSSSWQSLGDVRPTPRVLARLPEVRAATWAAGAVVALVVLGGPLLLGTNGQLKAGVIVVFAIVGASVVVLTGWSGQVSLGQMAFVGAGGAVGAALMVDRGWDPVVAMVAAGVVGAVVAVLVGLPALRLQGMYLAVTTLALSLAASAWIFSNRVAEWIPTGAFRRPDLLGRISLDSPLRLYYFALAVLVLVLLALRGIRRSRTGRVLVALRDNEAGVTAYGVSPTRAKLTAFALSGAVAAVAGVVLVIHQAAFRDVTYGPEESLTVFVSTVIGGLGSLTGGVLGAVFQRGAQWLLPAPWSFLATGVGVLFVLLSLPDGLGGLVWRGRDRVLAWAARRHGISALSVDRSADPGADVAAAEGPRSDDRPPAGDDAGDGGAGPSDPQVEAMR